MSEVSRRRLVWSSDERCVEAQSEAGIPMRQGVRCSLRLEFR